MGTKMFLRLLVFSTIVTILVSAHEIRIGSFQRENVDLFVTQSQPTCIAQSDDIICDYFLNPTTNQVEEMISICIYDTKKKKFLSSCTRRSMAHQVRKRQRFVN